MMGAALEKFRQSILGLDMDALIGIAVGLFLEKQELEGKLSELQEVQTGMAREYQALKNSLDKAEADRDALFRQNQRLTGVTTLHTNDLFGRSTEKTEEILKKAVSGKDTGQDPENPIDEDAEDGDPPGSQDVDGMSGPEVRRLLKELLGEKEWKKKEKGKRERDLSRLPVRESYICNVKELDETYGPGGWGIIRWSKTRTVEHVRSYNYLQVTYTADIETMAGQVFSPYRVEPLIEKSLVSPSLMSAIFYDKYRMFLPYYRQESDPERFGIPVSRQTMSNWEIHICEELFLPVYNHLRELMKGFAYQHCDETPWLVVRDGRGPGTKSFFWVHLSGELLGGYRVAFISFELTRASTHLIDFFGGAQHRICLTDDAYSGYFTARKEYPDVITLCGCLTHARRRFVNAILVMRIPSGITMDELSDIPEYKCILLIAKIYSTDEALKPLAAEERLKERQASVKPLFDEFMDYVKAVDTADPGVSDIFRDAVEYTINHEEELRQFLNDGNVPIDNGACERLIRNVARLRVNSLFSTTKRGAEASAVIMTLILTAQLNGADPYYYLKYLMEKLPKHLYQKPEDYVDAMVPWAEQYREYEISERQRLINSLPPPESDIRPRIKRLKPGGRIRVA